MYQLRIDLTAGRTTFAPGDSLSGTVRWQATNQPVREAEVQLIWFTRGYGDSETGVVSSLRFTNPRADDQRTFQLTLPLAPYSCQGKLVTVVWAVRLLLNRGAAAQQVEIVVSPTGTVVALHPAKAGPDHPQA